MEVLAALLGRAAEVIFLRRAAGAAGASRPAPPHLKVPCRVGTVVAPLPEQVVAEHPGQPITPGALDRTYPVFAAKAGAAAVLTALPQVVAAEMVASPVVAAAQAVRVTIRVAQAGAGPLA